MTELLEGETLRVRLGRGPLAWRKTAETGAALAEGLAAAHLKTVVHRDLKPENIFLTADGRVKILDFGVARYRPAERSGEEAETQFVTEEAVVIGTIGYMSPEQVRGATVGPPSDIFALGCVLYEMLSGRRAFRGPTSAEIASSILRDSPAELSVTGIALPREFERLIAHCLEKNPEERFQSARDLAFALKAILASMEAAPAATHAAHADPRNSIAVLPFANASREGITESIINTLTQVTQLRVTPRSTVFRYRAKDLDPQAIGRELNVRVVLTGRIIERGDALVVGTELIDVGEGMQLWGERYNRQVTDIFALEEEIARKISESLRMKLSGHEKERLAKRFTENSAAYQLYLKGRHHWTRRTPASMQKGLSYFQQAIEKDPGYALAYAGAADCHSMLAAYSVVTPREGWARGKAMAAAATALDPELAEGHTSLAFIRTFADWDWAGAEEGYRRALELNPAYWITPYWYSMYLTTTGRFDEAEQQAARAHELEPLLPMTLFVQGSAPLAKRRYAEALDRFTQATEIGPDYPLGWLWAGVVYEAQSRYEEALRHLKRGVELLENAAYAQGWLAHLYASMGNETGARGILRGLEEQSEHSYVDPYAMSVAHLGLGERDQAFECLNRALDTRSSWPVLLIRSDPRLDPVREDPRFGQFMRRMGLS